MRAIHLFFGFISSWFPNKTSLSGYIASISQLNARFPYSEDPTQQSISVSSIDIFGGALASNGYIYSPPGASATGLKTNIANQSASTFGSFNGTTFKYGGAIFANGSVYFITASSTVVAKVNINTDAVTWLDSSGVKGTESGNLGATIQKWYGAYLGQDGRIYCIPYNATAVMIIDPITDGITFLDTTGIVTGPGGNLSGSGKWDTGSCYGRYIYGTPSDATDIIKIDTLSVSCSRIGSFPAGTAKWAYQCLAPNGYIYFFPYFDNRIVKYNPSDDSFSYLATTIGSTDTHIKVGGVSLMPNGKILIITYGLPYTNNYILDPTNDSVASFVKSSNAAINGATLCPDGSVYAFPQGPATTLKRYYFSGRSISLPDNFTDSNFVKGY